jgi:hypothetical protein
MNYEMFRLSVKCWRIEQEHFITCNKFPTFTKAYYANFYIDAMSVFQ